MNVVVRCCVENSIVRKVNQLAECCSTGVSREGFFFKRTTEQILRVMGHVGEHSGYQEQQVQRPCGKSHGIV